MPYRAKIDGLLQAGRMQEAKLALEKVCKKQRKDPDAWMRLGCVYGSLGEAERSVDCLSRATLLRPDFAEAHSNLGIALKKLGRLDEAIASYERALHLRPDVAGVYNNRGNALLELGRLDEAIADFERAVALRPQLPESHYNLAIALNQRGLLERAADAFGEALRLRPTFPEALNNLGNVRLGLGRPAEAIECYDRALELQPESLAPVAGKVSALDKLERWPEARVLMQPHLDARVGNAGLAVTCAGIAWRWDQDDDVLDWLAQIAAQPVSDHSELARVHFAIGNLRDKKAQYQAAFEHYHAGNELRRTAWSRKKFTQGIDELIATFDGRPITRSSIDTTLPIFVVGMPRSGTTLVEQIIASHPRAAGAGEREELSTLVTGLGETMSDAGGYPRAIRSLKASSVDRLATGYLQGLRAVDPCAKRITDKMPHNFIHLGVIAALFPQAHVIHCRRDARDTCLSCYFQDFSGHHPYANDLEWLGHYYREYDRLMAHWKAVLDIPVLDVSYEKLVGDQQAVSREIIQFCGLSWDEACLRFNENRRIVATSSYDQVRRPLYSSSVGRWKHYHAFLGPLLRALGRDAENT